MTLALPEEVCRAAEGRRVPDADAGAVYGADLQELSRAAEAARIASKGRRVTFSKKAFFNAVNLCRDTCTYCSYKSGPADPGLSMMGLDDVSGLARLARGCGCVEALLVTGERPEERYAEARRWLRGMGFSSTAEYLVHASEAALAEGLFPHTNAGAMDEGQIRELRGSNVSMGLMLESSSARLGGGGMPHELAPSKEPGARIGALEAAGRCKMPITTGVLAGIGETPSEMVESLLEIRRLHERFGNIQEVIVQNFRPGEATPMRGEPPAGASYLARIVCTARLLMPGMNIQVPPNLLPGSYMGMVGMVNDWGGVSPLTPDHVNPGFAWPDIAGLESECAGAGYDLACRFPVYPEFMGMVPARLREMMDEVGEGGLVAGWRWR
ncbi:MAG: 7,8-didemethyl-8-hydroxy-5-deazariboflavin synthase CofG [Nitrosopumilus sp.]|nr:7,8-didemethyl-8-hydroxy-5-deazariboflavin synthase CofG [Nitrosopumilus sp.]CAI9831250.1 FO synthase subunit 1 [Nitrosopumilaceae archaeon]MDA7944659.1 7,8-didemethyl-8-hydroxy-5-deazariboflavin synthase CofG [Nitrosopumilus sp.]MDA7953274.1 7,8-didemethyl-8-hydroxy-5-deazariboflavin synthase CofG [Nitrosopumilus sp.]MDA7954582.1 7,8-didemethyl-8-hydroxy-5-deazariboflavin synthase CofG [Nitrosopumilus sp.]